MTNQVIFGTLGIRVDVAKIDLRTALNTGHFAVCAAKEEIRLSNVLSKDMVDQEFAKVAIRGTLFRFIRHIWHEMMSDEAKNYFCHRIEDFQHSIGVEHVQ